MKETIGFIGLGKLGLPMATNLIDAGYAVRVYNRSEGKAGALVARGAQECRHAAEVVEQGGIVISVVWDGSALEDIVSSEGFLEKFGQGGLHISMSTVPPEISRRVGALHTSHGSVLVEAPVFGRPEAASARGLSIPFVGPNEAKERARPILTALGAKSLFDLGEEHGSAVMVKLLGNFLIVSLGRSLAEAQALASRNGGDSKAILAILGQILLPIFHGYFERIGQGHPAFGQSLIPAKDVGILVDHARKTGTPTPIANLLLQLVS